MAPVNILTLTHADVLDEILRSILPEDLLQEVPSAFTVSGHLGASSSHGSRLLVIYTTILAHLNLREGYLPYKHVIGRVILEVSAALHYFMYLLSVHVLQKMKSIRTVVNKVDSIDNEFRVFKMEVLAGEPDFIVEVVCRTHTYYRRGTI